METKQSPPSRRVLVVDDNEDSAVAMAMLFKLSGNDVRVAEGGGEAIEVAETFRPDLILLDLGMPEISGYEVCRHIRQQPWGNDVVLAALTGWGRDEDSRRVLDAGFDHHFVKPISDNALNLLLDRKEKKGSDQ